MRKLLFITGGLLIVFLMGMALWPGCILHLRVRPNEASALVSLKSIREGQVAYSKSHAGFAPDLTALAGGGAIDSALAMGRKSGYTFTYTTGERVNGAIHAYTITALPDRVGSAGRVRFFSDESGEVHYNESGSADANNPVLQ